MDKKKLDGLFSIEEQIQYNKVYPTITYERLKDTVAQILFPNNIKISKNCLKGEEISSPLELIKCCDNNESVYHEVWGIKPARVISCMQFNIIVRAIYNKKLF